MSEGSDTPDMSTPAPRTERFGEGPEGAGERRERAAAAPSSPGPIGRAGEFLHETRVEMRRVTWPTALEVRNTTLVTLVTMIFFAVYLFGVDEVWAFLLDHLIKLLGGA